MELCFLLLTIVGTLNIPVIHGSFLDRAHEFPGPYCENRPKDNQCCPGRDDNCNAPIAGTYCYCDAFCNNTAHDCCPDFWGFCLGINPPTTRPLDPTPPVYKYGCIHHGIGYEPGQKVRDNCNECSCNPSHSNPPKYEMHCTNHRCAIEPDVIDWVNDGGMSWRSGNYSFLWGKTMDEAVKYRLGTIKSDVPVLRMSPLKVTINEVLPERFDSREEWPSYIHPVRDQGNCGASWAFSSSGVASDRLAIESGGVVTDTYSVQNLLSCHKRGQNGCEGGYLDRAWYFLRKKGVVNDLCYSYKSGKTDKVGPCKISYARKDGSCPDGSGRYTKMFKTTPPYRIAPVEREIMKEIRTNGPVQATFQVKPDFFSYKGGIYRFSDLDAAGKKADTVGLQSVKILGWGVERSSNGDILKYWICENSWGPQWGENGYFRVLKGSNECDIEAFIIGVFGRITGDRKLMKQLNRARRKRQRTSRRHSKSIRKNNPK